MKLSEVINPIKPIGAIPPATAKPATTAATATANVANVSPAGSTTTTQPAPSSSAGSPENKPLSSQSIDALAQVIKSAGLNPTQISQLLSKAK